MFDFDFEDDRLDTQKSPGSDEPWPEVLPTSAESTARLAEEEWKHAAEAPQCWSKCGVASFLEQICRICDAGEVPDVRWRYHMWDCVAAQGLLEAMAAAAPGAVRADCFYLPEEKTAYSPEVNLVLRHVWPVPEGASFLVVSFHWLRHLQRFLHRDDRDKVWTVTFLNSATSGQRHPLHCFMLVLDGRTQSARMVNCWRGVFTFAQWDGDGIAAYPEGDGATRGTSSSDELGEELLSARKRFGCGRWLSMEALTDFFGRLAELASAMRRNDVPSMHKHCAYLFGVPMPALYCWPPVISASVVVSELVFERS